MKLKHIALAATLAIAGTANATIDNGALGNGGLFFNIWDANGSYTRDLGFTIDSFQSQLAAATPLNLSWTADAAFTNYLAGVVNTAALQWNIMATDTMGARRILSTYTTLPATTKTNDVMRTAASAVQAYVNDVNVAMGSTANSVAVNSASAAWAGRSSFADTVGGLLNFSNAGTLANNSMANSASFMRIDAAAFGIMPSTYTPYQQGGQNLGIFIDANKTLNIAAMAPVPEPETFAMLLAGLGVMGAIARRRRQAVAA